MKAIDYLTRFETECLKLYDILSSNAHDPELKSLFQLLTDDRRIHLEHLLAFKETMPTDDIKSVQIERAEQVTNGYSQTMNSADVKKTMKHDTDAYFHVIHAEEEMIKLCAGMAKVENDDKIRTLLEWFVKNETQHLEEINGIYDFVEAPHYYLEWGEFSNLHSL